VEKAVNGMHIFLKYRRWRGIAALMPTIAVLMLTTACGTIRHATPPADSAQAPAVIEERLRRAAQDWEGTPHRLGGLDRNGIDCSGLVVRIYADLFGCQLPRTTHALARSGRPAGHRRLAPGDLVLFRPPGRKQHVGIYLGRNEFVHASANRGVMISRLDTRYWRRSFWTARRVLD
jgi:cell wall-associated NlpC family hydrolase